VTQVCKQLCSILQLCNWPKVAWRILEALCWFETVETLSRCKSRCKSPCTRQFLQTSQRKRLPGSCAVPRCAQSKNPSNPSWQLRNLFCHHWLIANDAKSYLSELLHPWRLWSSPSETWLSNLCTMMIDPHHGRAAKSFLDFRTPAWRWHWHCGKPFSQTRLL
jgi:hypothetical protein